MKQSKITVGKIGGEIGFLILCVVVHIEMFICMGSNSFINLIGLFISAILTVIIFIRCIVLGYFIESYLIDHKILKDEKEGKDNII